MNNSVEKIISDQIITVSRVFSGDYQKQGTVSCELKQTVEEETLYPGMSIETDLQDNLFSESDFSISKTSYTNTNTRVAWLDVPEGSTMEEIQEKLKASPKARIYRILSNEPILSNTQLSAINAGITTKAIIAERQVVRYPADHKTKAGQLVLDTNGKVQYKGNYFSKEGKADEDHKTGEKEQYLTERIKNELSPVGTHSIESQEL